MAISESELNRARYVRTVLAWHDMTQADLGRVLGITPQAANRKLKGIRAFKPDELVAIARAFGLDPRHLLEPPELADTLGRPGFTNMHEVSTGAGQGRWATFRPRTVGTVHPLTPTVQDPVPLPGLAKSA